MKLYSIDNSSEEIILFLTGWGCDERQFAHLKSEIYDVLIGYDYSDFELDFDFSKYKTINILAFSAGVFVASLIKHKLPKVSYSVAVNGNPLSYDKYFGLSENVQNIFKSISKDNILGFRKEYLVYSEEELIKLNKCQPHRTLESCMYELKSLQEAYQKPFIPIEYDLIWMSDSDKIFDLEKQKEYFKDSRVRIIPNAAHFPFFRFSTYEEFFIF